MPDTKKNSSPSFLLVLVLFAVYGAAYIYATSFLIDGERYFSLFDDAMISMRYARNLVAGHGLVMNPGEYVEGITNPLWTLFMAGVHLLPLPLSAMSLPVQIAGLVLLIVTLVLTKKSADMLFGSPAVSVGAVVLTAFYLPLITWTLQGMEVGVQAALLTGSVCAVLTALRKGTVPYTAYVLLAVGTLVRIDMAVPAAVTVGYCMIMDREQRMRHLLWGGGLLLVFLAGQTLFRLAYYGDLLPNTYYLKMTGFPIFFRITRGVRVFIKFLTSLSVLLVVPVVIVSLYAMTRETILLWTLILFQVLYSIYVGGDAWEWGGSNRFISVVMPLFFILAAHSLYKIAAFVRVHGLKEGARFRSLTVFFNRYLYLLLVVVALGEFNSAETNFTLRGLFLIDRPVHVEDNRSMVEQALTLKQFTRPDARIAVTWAGAIPYFSERYTVDLLGKADAHIARIPMRVPDGWARLTAFYPGHLKYDYSYSIGELEPDVVLQFWGDLQEAEPYIMDTYSRVVIGEHYYYIRRDSEAIRWELFNRSGG